MKSIVFLLLMGLSFFSEVAVGDQQVRIVRLEAHESFRYSQPEITARPGERIKLVLKNVSDEPGSERANNWVLLKKGTSAREFVSAGQDHRNNDYIDPALEGKIIARTRMVSAGKEGAVSFTVPSEPGRYTYLCTSPGHYSEGMKGFLIVK